MSDFSAVSSSVIPLGRISYPVTTITYMVIYALNFTGLNGLQDWIMSAKAQNRTLRQMKLKSTPGKSSFRSHSRESSCADYFQRANISPNPLSLFFQCIHECELLLLLFWLKTDLHVAAGRLQGFWENGYSLEYSVTMRQKSTGWTGKRFREVFWNQPSQFCNNITWIPGLNVLPNITKKSFFLTNLTKDLNKTLIYKLFFFFKFIFNPKKSGGCWAQDLGSLILALIHKYYKIYKSDWITDIHRVNDVRSSLRTSAHETAIDSLDKVILSAAMPALTEILS